MAPPPPATLPLADRIKALAQTLQLVALHPKDAFCLQLLISPVSRFGWFVGYVRFLHRTLGSRLLVLSNHGRIGQQPASWERTLVRNNALLTLL